MTAGNPPLSASWGFSPLSSCHPFVSYVQGFPLLSAGRSSPDPFSSDPASPTIWGAGRAPRLPTTSPDGSLCVNVSNPEQARTFKTEEVGFFHLREGRWNDLGKGTAGVFPLEGSSCLSHRITLGGTTSHTMWCWFGCDLRQREWRRGRLAPRGGFPRLRRRRGTSRGWVCFFRFLLRLREKRLGLFCTLPGVERHLAFSPPPLHLPTAA